MVTVDVDNTDELEGVAIIGMAGRFPGARTLDAFWQNLCHGQESITRLVPEEDRAVQRDPSLLDNPLYVPAGAFLDDIDLFDAPFFGYSAREARFLDPQQRLFLECAWEALERAGYDASQYAGRIGIYAGSSMNAYALEHIYANRSQFTAASDFELMLHSEKDFLATRTAYKLGLKGPAITVQTACSTSLVAVTLAYQSLLQYQCDMVLAGGVALQGLERAGYLYEQGGIASPDGHCRAFDADAQGTVGGSGVGVVVLKRLSDALRDGDTIYAVIKGAAINNDGDNKMGYTTPSVDGQADVIAEALALAGFTADTVSYVETHGTGTYVGDPIEIAALTKAFHASSPASTQKHSYCAIGSVKTNIGHLDAAAGVVGLIKTCLALFYKKIPPSLHFQRPNPQIDFAQSPFYVNIELLDWPEGDTPRRAGVSSFGIGGTNVHLLLEEAVSRAEVEPLTQETDQLILLSAKTASALESMTDNLVAYVQSHSEVHLADIAFTLQLGRRAMPYRRMIVSSTREHILSSLRSRDVQHVFSSVLEPGDRSIVFIFPGQGAQYIQMGKQLYATEPVYRQWVDYCADRLRAYLNVDLRELLFPTADLEQQYRPILDQTDIAQSALFVTEYALARLLEAYGILPDVMIGHSLGEYVAACLAGVISLDDVLYLVSERGRLMQAMEKGAMLSISASEEFVQSLLDERVSVAVVFGASLCVVGGSYDAIAQLERRLTEERVDHSRLHTSHAFHSPMMDPMLEPFRAVFNRITLHPPRIPYISCATGTWILATEAVDPNYWIKHLRQTVRIGDGIQTLLAKPGRLLVEVGPSQTLRALLRQLSPQIARATFSVVTMRHPLDRQSDKSTLLNAIGKLWLAGVSIHFATLVKDQQRQRVVLPTYPFERQRYWIEAPQTILAKPRDPSISSIEPVEEITDSVDGAVNQFRSTLFNEYVAPRSAIESKVAAIWQEFLGIEEIGIYDNFFELGGHSLLAIGLIARLREEFHIDLQAHMLYEQSSIAALSDVIQHQTQQKLQRIVPVARGQFLPASWHQQRRWRRYLLHPEQSLNDNLSIGWVLQGHLPYTLFERSVNEVVKRHETLRTAFAEHSGQVVQVIQDELVVTIPLTDLRYLPFEEREAHMLQMAAEIEQSSFDMRQAPLWRMHLYRLDEDLHAWIIVAHQAVWDGVSAENVLYEVGVILTALIAGQSWQLPALPIQFADFVYWEQQHFQEEILQEHLSYWRKIFAAHLTPLQLPTDYPRPEKYAPSDQLTWTLAKPLVERLKAVGYEQKATLYMVMVAAIDALFYLYTGQEDILIESSFPNRERAELASMVAPLVNMITLRTSMSGDPTFRELLGRVREVVIGAIAHRDFPFVKVLEELQPEYYTVHDRLGRVFMAQYTTNDSNPPLPGLAYQKRLWFRRGMPDIYISLLDYDSSVEVCWEYSTGLFDKGTINRMFSEYVALMEQISADPDKRLSALTVANVAVENGL